MDKLPIELLTLISFYACTDGGQTGCYLSLVSRRVRAASRPARFFSVALVSSATKIEQFLLCYEAERSRSLDILPRVRHLCLSLFGQGLDASFGANPNASAATTAPEIKRPTSRAEFFAAMQRRTQRWRSGQDSLDEHYNRVVPALVRAVAPDVYSLSIIQTQWRASSVVDCSFPCLRELTLCGGDPSFLPLATASTPDAHERGSRFPALQRLHHILTYSGREVDFVRWAHHAPNVTHLRVSRLDHEPRVAVDSFDHVIGKAAADELFPHLQVAIMEPHPAPPDLQVANTPACVAFRDFLAHLQQVAERARVPVAVLPPFTQPKLPPGTAPYQMCVARVRKIWRERIEGEDACWAPGSKVMQKSVPQSTQS